MDSRTLIVIAVLFMLLNSGVLGLMRKSLAQDVRPAASDWLWGMLLMASGLAIVALQGRLSPMLLYPSINGAVMLGAAFLPIAELALGLGTVFIGCRDYLLADSSRAKCGRADIYLQRGAVCIYGRQCLDALFPWRRSRRIRQLCADGDFCRGSSVFCFPVHPSALVGTTAFLLMCTDRLRMRWERAAVIDDLTGLPNRRRIMATGVACFETACHDGR